MGAMDNDDVVALQLEKVDPKVAILFERDQHWYTFIEKRPVEIISSRDMRVPLKLKDGGYFGHFDPAGGDLGRGSGAKYDKATLATVNLKHAVEWDTESEWATDNNRKAVLRGVKKLLADAMPSFRKHVDSLALTGGNGVLAVASAVTGGDPDVVTLGTDGFGARLVRDGQRGTWYEPDLSAPIDGSHLNVEIVAIDQASKKISTSPQTTGLAAADVFIAESLTGASPVSLYGLPYHHSDASTGTWQGMNRANFAEIRCNSVDASAPLALHMPRLAINKIGNRRGIEQGKKLVAWLHPAQVQAYEALGQLVIQLNKSNKDEGLNLYFGDNMQLAGAPARKHFSWDKTRIDFVDPNIWGRAEMKAAHIYEVGGTKVFEVRGVTGGVAAAQIFYIAASFQIFTRDPGQDSYIKNLTVPSGY